MGQAVLKCSVVQLLIGRNTLYKGFVIGNGRLIILLAQIVVSQCAVGFEYLFGGGFLQIRNSLILLACFHTADTVPVVAAGVIGFLLKIFKHYGFGLYIVPLQEVITALLQSLSVR